jgi:hypothetical protein
VDARDPPRTLAEINPKIISDFQMVGTLQQPSAKAYLVPRRGQTSKK